MSNNFGYLGQGTFLGVLSSDPVNGREGEFYYNSQFKKLRFFNGTVWHSVGTGSGTGLGLDFIPNGDFEDGVPSPFYVYQNTPQATPVNGQGGTPVSTLTVNGTNPLSGIYDGIFAKDNNNRQGEGWAVPFSVDNARKGQLLQIDFDFLVGGGFTTGSSSDLQIFIFDLVNNVLIPIDNPFIETASGHFIARFNSAKNSLNYLLIGHIATASVSAWTFEFDNVSVGLPSLQQVASNGDRQVTDFASVGTGNGVVGTLSFTAKATARYRITVITTFGPNAGTSDIMGITYSGTAPTFFEVQNGRSYAGPTPYRNGSTAVALADLVAGQSYTFQAYASVPGSSADEGGNMWAEQITPDTSFQTIGVASKVYASQLIAQGTRVTTTPSQIGEWRSQLRNGGGVTYTDTNGDPAIFPTVADGIAIYGNTSWASSDPNNQPSRYEIFIGFNKVFRSIFYNGAARFNPVDGRPIQLGTAAAQGHVEAYDPLTGVYSVAGFWGQFATEVTHYGGQDTASGSVGTPFFDVEISDNPAGIGFAGYVGEIKEMATDIVPPGTLECNGQAISRTQYARLFAVIGTRFGVGDGSTTFNLPPSGVFYRSWDHGAGNDPDSGARSSLNGGASGDNVGSYQGDQNQSHTHGNAPHAHIVPASNKAGIFTAYATSGYSGYQSSGAAGIAIYNSGGNQSNPRNVNVMKVIVY